MPLHDQLRCLVFDDGKTTETLQRCLSQLGHRVTAAHLPDAALRELARRDYCVAFTKITGNRSLELMASMLATRPELALVAVIEPGDTRAALEAGKRGASDCVSRPFAPDQLQDIVLRLQEHAQHAEVDSADNVPWSESNSPSLRGAVSLLKRAARCTAPVLLSGERGTGRRALVRLLHARSRPQGPLVVMNCAPETLDAETPKLFEAARHGTLLLEEVAELSLDGQAKLLDFIERGRLDLSSAAEHPASDARVVALTEHDLDARRAAGHFRPDLHDRLRALSVHLPALRERREDIVALSRKLVALCAARAGRPAPELSPATEALLTTYDWAGNVRELESELERALAVGGGHVIEPSAFSDRLCARPTAPYLGGNFTLEQIEREHIERVLEQGGTFDAAAHLLGIDDSTLWRKRKRFGVSHAA